MSSLKPAIKIAVPNISNLQDGRSPYFPLSFDDHSTLFKEEINTQKEKKPAAADHFRRFLTGDGKAVKSAVDR
jgi:hypothetical protein